MTILSPLFQKRFVDAVLAHLRCTYVVDQRRNPTRGGGYTDGQKIEGQAVSFLLRSLRDMGWKGLGNLNDFETLLYRAGFKVVEARSERRNQLARVVTL